MEEKIQHSIELLREHEPEGGYALAFSGGKDSVAIKQLAIESGIKFRAFYSVTTIDYPDVVDFIRTQHKDVECSETPKADFSKDLLSVAFFQLDWLDGVVRNLKKIRSRGTEQK